MARRNLILAFGAAAFVAGALPVFAQDEPQLKVKLGNQSMVRGFEIENGPGTQGSLKVGPNLVRLEIDDAEEAKWVKNSKGDIIGGSVGFRLRTEVSVPIRKGRQAPDSAEVAQVAEESKRRPVYLSNLAADAHLTTRGVGAEGSWESGVQPTKINKKEFDTKINLGIMKIGLAGDGATTRGPGSSKRTAAAFDVDWSTGRIMFRLGGGMTLPRFLSGRGLDGTVVVTLQINEKLVAAIHKAITFVKTRLERLQQKLIGGAHMISDVAKGFRGPAQDSGAEIAVPAVGDPVDLSRAAEIRIAYRFAPVIHQIVGTAGYPQTADMMRRVDYDGDWDTTNNWNNTDSANADNGGYAYYDVKESATHYFVTYAFYYARRSGNYATRHENDMTGIVVVARKGARAGEEIELVQLRESNSFDHYAAEAAEGWKANGVSKHSPLNFIDEVDHPYYDTERTHPQIFVKAAGHGVYGYNGRNDVSAFFGNPGITYQPKANPAVPGLPNSTVGYSLIPMSDLENIKTLTEDGKMDGNEGFAQHARLPSSWPGFENPAKRLEKIYPGVDFGGSVLPPVVETRGPAVRGMLDVVEDSTEDLELRIRILELERERLEIERIDLDNARPLRRVGGNEDADIETELKRLDALDVNGLEKEFERLNKLSREGRE